uniref:ABC 3 transport family protein n=1 Tax=Candidatus Kentrum sp. LPFa TaxID=2126335 RepID=A0A450WAR8_9GAMM|nr:MAG: ABC 3 transport family protein [Candidatus Kentron sp. LPFa]
MNLAALDVGILGPAFVTGLIVLLTHVPLGHRVLARGIIFIDLAVAQIAGLGVIAAHVLGSDSHGVVVQLSAFGAAIIGALLLYGAERRWPDVQEAVIGSAFILAATAAIILLASDPRGGEHLHDLLAGQILWVDFPRLLLPFILSVLVLALWFPGKVRNSPSAFYILFRHIGYRIGTTGGRLFGFRKPYYPGIGFSPVFRTAHDNHGFSHRCYRLRYRVGFIGPAGFPGRPFHRMGACYQRADRGFDEALCVRMVLRSTTRWGRNLPGVVGRSANVTESGRHNLFTFPENPEQNDQET